MSDFSSWQVWHKPIGLYRAYRYCACRAATVDAIVGEKPGTVPGQYIPRYLEVQRAYKERLIGLHHAGYYRVQGPKRLTYAMNCPPADVKTASKFEKCKLLVAPHRWEINPRDPALEALEANRRLGAFAA